MKRERRAQIRRAHPILALIQQLIIVFLLVAGFLLLAILNKPLDAMACFLACIPLEIQLWAWDEDE